MVITEILARNARVYGEEPALVERNAFEKRRTEITWNAFHEQANQIAHALNRQGVRKGDRVVLLMMNCLEWLPIYFGILRSGAIAVPLNFRFQAMDISRCVAVSEAKILIFGEEFIDRIKAVKVGLDEQISAYIFSGKMDKTPGFAFFLENLTEKENNVEPNIEVNLTDGAGIYFTSGTTGKPKGVYLSHRQLESACYVENYHHKQTHSDNFLCIPPLYHTGAKMHWFGNFIVGARGVILKGEIKPKTILKVVSEERVTIVWLLVPWAHDILVAIDNNEIQLADYHLEQWRLMHIGAQPVPPTLVDKWKHYFPSHDYDTNYGLTETTGPGCVHLGIENSHKIGAIGVPGFDWECRIVDEQMNNQPTETPGELVVKGPGVMLEYYRNPKATEAILSNGWLRTGDIAQKDKDGFIWLIDRKKDVIITGGENIFPVEIENYLITNESIYDAGVIGIADERLGEIPIAVISLKSARTLSEEDIKNFCEGLPRYKRPRKVFFDDIPRNPTGKIEKPKLRKKYSK